MRRFWDQSGWVAIGFVAGLIVGTTGVATAAFGKKGWERFGVDFKQGYVTGFLDCVRVAKNYDQGGFVAREYRSVPKASNVFWVLTVDDFYTKPENAERTLANVMTMAGRKLEEKFGPDPTPDMTALAEALEKYEQKARRGELPGQKQTAEQAAAAASGSSDVPGVKTRRRACVRDCNLKADAERTAAGKAKPPSPDRAASDTSAAKPSLGKALGGIPMGHSSQGSAGNVPASTGQTGEPQAPAAGRPATPANE